jgi:hypothetical protein
MPPPTIINAVPREVIAAPYTLWFADVGAIFPTLDEDPDPDDWTKVGTSGALNYDDGAGVTVAHPQSLNYWRSHGDAGSRKVFRQDEDFKCRIVLADMTLEQYALALNNNAVTTVNAGVGTSGYKSIGLSRGFGVATMALLVRGAASAYLEQGISQYQIWRASQSGTPEVVFKKADPAGLALEWTALVDPEQAATDPTWAFGKLLVATTEPGT